ncbi:hypothetical protein, partial [Pseudomonas sp. FEN]
CRSSAALSTCAPSTTAPACA